MLNPSRRNFLRYTASAGAVASYANHIASAEEGTGELARGSVSQPKKRSSDGIRYCLNMSTIRGQNLSVPEQIDLAAKAGYDSIEPWLRELQQYVETGGNPNDLRKRIADAGLKVDSAIGFAEWIVDDQRQRAAGLEMAKRDMELILQIGGTHIAAPPVGATKQTDLNLYRAAERYRTLLEIGDSIGVIPQLEVWGFSTTFHRLGDVMLVAVECQHPAACVLPDVYHLYKGGNSFDSLKLLSGSAVHCFHMNDYPANPPRETIADKDRVYPGEGIAPLKQILGTLLDNGFQGALSLELFNPEYWRQDALTVAQTGLQRMRAAVATAVARE